MWRRGLLSALLLMLITFGAYPTAAQGGADAWTYYDLNMRSGPGASYEVITLLPSGSGLLLEARDADAYWVLGHTEDGSFRGWVVFTYLEIRAGLNVMGLPTSEEVVSAAAPAEAEAEENPNAQPINGALDSKTLVYSTGHSEYYRITYWSDGLLITGFLGYPTGDGPFPAVIYNRGGAWNTGRLTGRELVPLVESGYVAIGSQYRGNAGSGGNEQFGWGEVNDVLNLIPLLKGMPNVDANRIGMMGGSRGGMVTYMALKEQTMRGTYDIKAAVTVGGISDLFMWAEERPPIVEDVYLPLIGAAPADAYKLYQMRSAVYWPELINTPLLLLHGEADSEVSVKQSQKLYNLLLQAGKPVQLITYPGDDHPLSGQLGGFPAAQRFFATYLSAPGDPDRQFDSHWTDINAVSTWFAVNPQ